MITQCTQDIIREHGWIFIPYRDAYVSGYGDIAVPECWIHDFYPTQYSVEDVLNEINQAIELQIERELA